MTTETATATVAKWLVELAGESTRTVDPDLVTAICTVFGGLVALEQEVLRLRGEVAHLLEVEPVQLGRMTVQEHEHYARTVMGRKEPEPLRSAFAIHDVGGEPWVRVRGAEEKRDEK